jgi:uncharacterized membrane protein
MKAFFSFLLLLSFLGTPALMAQCPMCGEAARTSLKEGNNAAKGINTGIFYLLAGPYLMLMGGGFVWYRARKKAKLAFQASAATENTTV